MSVKSIDPKIIKKIRQKIQFRREVARKIDDIESKVRKERQKTHHKLVKEMSQQAGINLNNAIEEGLKRNKVQRRFVDHEYKKLQKIVKNQIKTDTKKQIKFEKEYHEKYFKDLPEKEGNPCLLFWEPDEELGPGEHITSDGPGGMVGSGCREPRLSLYESESIIELSSEYSFRNHIFYPRNYVRTGEDDSHVWQRVQQDIVIERRPIESGRGNFNVQTMQLWLRGMGYCELRPGDPPCGHGVIGPSSEARVEVDVMLAQRHDDAPDGYYYTYIYNNDYYWVRYDSYSGEANIEPYIGNVDPAIIYGPDYGGHELYIFFSLTTYVGAYLEDAQAELDFSGPESEGINLHDIRLCGDYDS
ncbi:MAG: hypothetical protein A2Y66_03050 [Nitrospirae bacterium RBG_13_41_22]|nr:MAG: hypothetical protein A2Y66_03050 [Nitrospirae bacterium RBG_13_41_22]